MGGMGGSAHHDKIVGFDIIICIVCPFQNNVFVSKAFNLNNSLRIRRNPS